MKKENNDVVRLQNLIENDRLKFGGSFEELLVVDLDKLLKEYFDYKVSPMVAITKTSNSYKINISINATRIKSFGIVAKWL